MCFEFPWWKEILSSFLFCFVFSLLHKWVGRKERKFSGWNCKEKKKSPTFFYFLESKVCLTSIDADTVFEFLDPLHISTSSYYKVCKILSFCFILFVGEFLSSWFFFLKRKKLVNLDGLWENPQAWSASLSVICPKNSTRESTIESGLCFGTHTENWERVYHGWCQS